MIQQLINRYKQLRTERYLNETYHCQYAFVGMGQHSLTNLYPVLQYLQVPLKYICVKSGHKKQLIQSKYNHVIATTQLDDVLNDESIKGVFVAAAPSAHFSLAKRILQSGKSLFIEKPPCQSVEQLHELIDLQQSSGSRIVTVGLQKRYAPAMNILKKRLKKEKLLNYDLHYLTGAYPEGNPLLDLFIHPLDLVTWLFGMAEVISCLPIDEHSFIMMLKHQYIVGTVELSTSHSWADPQETLSVRTRSGSYQLNYAQDLTYHPISRRINGLPLDKIMHRAQSVKYLCHPDNFSPILANNTIYTQGFYSEVNAFINAVEGGANQNLTDLPSIEPTMKMISKLSL